MSLIWAHDLQHLSQVTVLLVVDDFLLFVSNLVTPDGNGMNDTWWIENATTFETLNVWLYDRWGNEVLAQQGYNQEWEGVINTDLLPDGTYYYVITFDNSERIYKGAVSVLRNLE